MEDKYNKDDSQISLLGLNSMKKNQKEDINPRTYRGIYAMHKYWAKKPHNLVSQYIKRFSKEGDIVLDSFCGSGVTVIESVRLNRRAIGIDINPIATFITRMGLQHVDTNKLERTYQSLISKVERRINKLYQTKCPACSNPEAIITHAIWENKKVKEVWIKCDDCKTRKTIREGTKQDTNAATDPKFPVASVPDAEMIENSRINVKKGAHVKDLFTPRAQTSLTYLLSKIREIQDEKIKNTLEFCFSASIPQASSLVFVIRRRSKGNNEKEDIPAEVGSWVIGYWVPNEHFEINVIRCFKNRFKRILKGKKQINDIIPKSAVEHNRHEELIKTQMGYYIKKGNSTNLSITSNTIDYVFTDPPHGNRLPYLELSLMWNTWLDFNSIEWEEEIVVSQAKNRKKGIKDYESRLKVAIEEIYRVLKPNKFMSIAFNSLDDKTWLSVLVSLLSAGFTVFEISSLSYSAGSVVQDTRKNALKTDFVITCQKKLKPGLQKISFRDDPENIIHLINEFLITQDNRCAQTYKVLNHLITQGITNGKIHKISMILKTLERDFIYRNGNWLEKEN